MNNKGQEGIKKMYYVVNKILKYQISEKFPFCTLFPFLIWLYWVVANELIKKSMASEREWRGGRVRICM